MEEEFASFSVSIWVSFHGPKRGVEPDSKTRLLTSIVRRGRLLLAEISRGAVACVRFTRDGIPSRCLPPPPHYKGGETALRPNTSCGVRFLLLLPLATIEKPRRRNLVVIPLPPLRLDFRFDLFDLRTIYSPVLRLFLIDCHRFLVVHPVDLWSSSSLSCFGCFVVDSGVSVCC